MLINSSLFLIFSWGIIGSKKVKDLNINIINNKNSVNNKELENLNVSCGVIISVASTFFAVRRFIYSNEDELYN